MVRAKWLVGFEDADDVLDPGCPVRHEVVGKHGDSPFMSTVAILDTPSKSAYAPMAHDDHFPGGNVRAIMLLTLAAAFTGCLASREPSSGAAVPDPQVIFESLLARDAQLQEGNVELTDQTTTLSLLMGRESGPARLCLLGELRVRNPLFDPLRDDPDEEWTILDGPLAFDTNVTLSGRSVFAEIDLDGRRLPISGTLSSDWETLRLSSPLLGSMRLSRARAFPACEATQDDDSAP